MIQILKKSIEIIAYLPNSFTYVKKFNPITYIDSDRVEKGFVLPLWTDINIRSNYTHCDIAAANGYTESKGHLHRQTGHNFYSDYHHEKIVSPWHVKSDIPLLYQPVNNLQIKNPEDIALFPGFLKKSEFEYVNPTNIFCFVKKPLQNEKPKELVLKSGIPIMHLIPITACRVVLRIEMLDDQVFEDKFAYNVPKNHFCGSKLKQDSLAKKIL